MTYRLFDFSSDQGVEGDGATIGEAFVELGRALAHVLTDGSKLAHRAARDVDVAGAPDVPGTAVAFLNELIFLFDTEQFLVDGGTLGVETDASGRHHVRGKLVGDLWDENRHGAGRGVKAATYHDASHRRVQGRERVRIILDL